MITVLTMRAPGQPVGTMFYSRRHRWLVLLAFSGSVALNGVALWFAVRFSSHEPDVPESPTLQIAFSVAVPKQPVVDPKPVIPIPRPTQPPPKPPESTSSLPPTATPKAAAAAPAPSSTPTEVVPTPEPVPVEREVAPIVESAPPVFPPIPEEAATSTDSAPIFNARYLRNPKVPYPLEAKRMGIQGTVVLNVVVSPQGKAETIDILTSSGSAILDEAAVAAVREWRFLAAYRGMQAVTEAVVVPVRFALDGD